MNIKSARRQRKQLADGELIFLLPGFRLTRSIAGYHTDLLAE
jgi:hypothetical protein